MNTGFYHKLHKLITTYHKLMKDLVKIIYEASSRLSRFASPGYQILYFYGRIPAVPVLTDISKKEEEELWEDYKLDDNQVSDSSSHAQLCGLRSV